MRGRSNDPVDLLVILTLFGVGTRLLWHNQAFGPESLPDQPAKETQPDQAETIILPPIKDATDPSHQSETDAAPESQPELTPAPIPESSMPSSDLAESTDTITLDGQVNEAEAPAVLPAD